MPSRAPWFTGMRMSEAHAALEVVVLVGIPASGKSTFFRERYGATHEHVSKDLIKSSRDRSDKHARLFDEALVAGRSVVVDSTNPTAEDRAAIVEIARHDEARAVAYYFDTAVSDALRRNVRRAGRARVPDIAVHVVADRMCRPRHDEGFDELCVVRLAEGRFSVELATTTGLARRSDRSSRG